MLKSPDYKEARDFLMGQVSVMPVERVPLADCAGRILAEDVYAGENVPPFARSPYDGYAYRAGDTKDASKEHPVTLRILEEVPAGSMWTTPVTEGTATKILTGAPVPEGADCVIMYEKTSFTAETVTIFQPGREGDNICPIGEDVSKGQLLARAGTIIDGALQGTLAAQGIVSPAVYQIPTIGVISTGSELVEADEALSGGKIVNTNRYTFSAAVTHLGCKMKYFGTPGDSVEGIAGVISAALAECELVLTTGGVSAGDYDFTPAAMEAAGAPLILKSIAMKPGSACAFGKCGEKLVCGLSGNPASAMTCYLAVVLPALRKLMGLNRPLLPEVTVTLKNEFKKKTPRTRLIRGTMDLSDGTVGMWVEQGQGNGVLHSLIGCNLLAEVPAGSPKLPAGTVLKGYLIP